MNETNKSSPYIFDLPVQVRYTRQISAPKPSEDVETCQIIKEAAPPDSSKWLDWIGYAFIMLTLILGLATVIVQIKLLFLTNQIH